MVYRGSRKHVLDWTAQPRFLEELTALFPQIPVTGLSDAKWMPRGAQEPAEARLESFGPKWLPSFAHWGELEDWWLVHKRGANTPNWDIAVGCTIEDRPGLVLVEAKANWPELKPDDKKSPDEASNKSKENHEQIAKAIVEACLGWQQIDSRIQISCDTHYQLANRLAFTWKLAKLGISVVLLYVGFLGDAGIAKDAGKPFSDDEDWQKAFREYADPVVPLETFDRRLTVGPSSVWLLSRSRPILELSPPLD